MEERGLDVCTFPRARMQIQTAGRQENRLRTAVGKRLSVGGERGQKLPLSSQSQLCQDGAYFYLSFLLTVTKTGTWEMGGFPEWVTDWASGKVSRTLRACFPAAQGAHLPTGGPLLGPDGHGDGRSRRAGRPTLRAWPCLGLSQALSLLSGGTSLTLEAALLTSSSQTGPTHILRCPGGGSPAF